VRNLLQNPYDIIHLTLDKLLHYLGKYKLKLFCRYKENTNQLHFVIASNFVIHPQILICIVLKI